MFYFNYLLLDNQDHNTQPQFDKAVFEIISCNKHVSPNRFVHVMLVPRNGSMMLVMFLDGEICDIDILNCQFVFKLNSCNVC